MKIYKNLLMIAAMAIAFTACSQEGDVPVLPTDEQPISFSASVPVKAFGVESRAADPTDWALYYQLKGTKTFVSSTGDELDVTSGTEYSFKARYAYKYKEGNEDKTEHRDLVWSLIQKDDNKATFYLTATTKDGVAYWAKAEVADGTPVIFGEMKPRKTRFILNLTVSGSKENKSGFTFSLSGVKKAADNAIVTEQAWPFTSNSYVEKFSWDLTSDAVNGKYTYSNDFAPQTVGDLTIKYGDKFTWVKSLNFLVDYKGSDNTIPGQLLANTWTAGCQITLNVTIQLDELNAGNITVEGFTTATGDYNFDGVVQTNP